MTFRFSGLYLLRFILIHIFFPEAAWPCFSYVGTRVLLFRITCHPCFRASTRGAFRCRLAKANGMALRRLLLMAPRRLQLRAQIKASNDGRSPSARITRCSSSRSFVALRLHTHAPSSLTLLLPPVHFSARMITYMSHPLIVVDVRQIISTL